MSTATKKEKYATFGIFTEAIEALHKRFDAVATKDDLKEARSVLTLAIQQNSADIADLKEIVTTKADHDIIIRKLDSFLNDFRDMDRKTEFLPRVVNEMKAAINNHETRLFALESNRPPAT